MPPAFQELDYRETPMGELVLQRRQMVSLGGQAVFEVKLAGDYLMSSLFHTAETALADLALSRLAGEGWSVVVGGLGLGYTAAAALAFPQVDRLVVVEALGPVIDWHRQGLVPNGGRLAADPRCTFHEADFFALARSTGFDPEAGGRRFDAILLDIDHTPDQLLDSGHADLYTETGLERLRDFLKPGGVFALWSNNAPEAAFLKRLGKVFTNSEGHEVQFDNPLQGRTVCNGIYLGQTDPTHTLNRKWTKEG
jgi:spermidine synthase